jgi:hypothetical protein
LSTTNPEETVSPKGKSNKRVAAHPQPPHQPRDVRFLNIARVERILSASLESPSMEMPIMTLETEIDD